MDFICIALFHLPPKRGGKERSAPFGSGSTAGSPPLHQTLTNDAGLGGESSSAEVASSEAGTFILFVLVCIEAQGRSDALVRILPLTTVLVFLTDSLVNLSEPRTR